MWSMFGVQSGTGYCRICVFNFVLLILGCNIQVEEKKVEKRRIERVCRSRDKYFVSDNINI